MSISRPVLLAAFVVSATMISSAANVLAQERLLSDGGTTPYRIVISRRADVSTRAVADDFADILKQITGATFPIVTDDVASGNSEIIVGEDNARREALQLDGMTQGFVRGEYRIRTAADHLVIAGAPPRGTINGMYGFLQDHLGCRWFTPGCTRLPAMSTLRIGDIDDHQRPAFLSRSTSGVPGFDAAWTARNRLNECKAGGGSLGIRMLMDDPRVKTIGNYYRGHALGDVPDSLFDEHPEYYCQVDGKRVRPTGGSITRAFCVTSQGLVEYMAERLKRILKSRGADQGRRLVGLGHADTGKHCHCPTCTESYERIGLSGTYMEFNNKVAALVTQEYPDAVISTLAYGITFKPPPVKIHPNVRVIWCPITHCCAHALGECAPNRDRNFLGQLSTWREKAPNLGVWYYHHQYDALMPHMKLHATAQDFATFASLGIDTIYVENNTGACLRTKTASDGDKLMPAYGNSEVEGHFIVPFQLLHVKSYILCRLFWDAAFDWKEGVRDFCETYYGPAARELTDFILAVESIDSYQKTLGTTFASYAGVHQDNGHSPLMKWSVIEEMDALFDRAEEKAKSDKMYLRRVQMARTSLDLAILCFATPDHPLREKAFGRFFSIMEEIGLKFLHSTSVTRGRTTLQELKKVVSDPRHISIPGQEPVGANLLANSSFEADINADGIPDNWRADGDYLPEGYILTPEVVAMDTSKAHSGKSSLRLTKTPAPNATVSIRQRFDAQPGQWYRATASYQAEVKNGRIVMIFTAFDKDGKWLRHGGGVNGLTHTGDKWMELSADTRARDDTAQLMVEFLFYDDQSEGVAWIDDFECAKVTGK